MTRGMDTSPPRPSCAQPIVALSLTSLRKRIEIALLPDEVRVVLQLMVSPSANATAAGRKRSWRAEPSIRDVYSYNCDW